LCNSSSPWSCLYRLLALGAGHAWTLLAMKMSHRFNSELGYFGHIWAGTMYPSPRCSRPRHRQLFAERDRPGLRTEVICLPVSVWLRNEGLSDFRSDVVTGLVHDPRRCSGGLQAGAASSPQPQPDTLTVRRLLWWHRTGISRHLPSSEVLGRGQVRFRGGPGDGAGTGGLAGWREP